MTFETLDQVVYRLVQHGLERCTIPAEGFAFDGHSRDTTCPGSLETTGIGAVGNHHGDLRREILLPRCLNQCGHVRPTPGNQDCDTALHGLTMRDRVGRYKPRDAHPQPGSPRPVAQRFHRFP